MRAAQFVELPEKHSFGPRLAIKRLVCQPALSSRSYATSCEFFLRARFDNLNQTQLQKSFDTQIGPAKLQSLQRVCNKILHLGSMFVRPFWRTYTNRHTGQLASKADSKHITWTGLHESMQLSGYPAVRLFGYVWLAN